MSNRLKSKLLNKPKNDNFQITDLLQLSRKEQEIRRQCRLSMRRFSEWKKMHSRYVGNKIRTYSTIEGIILKRQARDAVYLYRMVKKDRMSIFERYLEQLPPRFLCGAVR